jgi:hypothetical protein
LQFDLSSRFHKPCTYTSNHNIVNSVEKSFSPFSEIDQLVPQNQKRSQFLSTLSECHNRITCASEFEVVAPIRNILRDVLCCVGLTESVYLAYEGELAGSRSDVWVVRKNSGVPVAVIEVKQPGSSKMENLHVLGQVFDYICNLRNSFGQCEVFGILTTLAEWRVCWLPDSDSFAASVDELDPLPVEDLSASFPLTAPINRTLSCSRVYGMTDPSLLRVIGTVFLKSIRSQYLRVSFISVKAYVILNQADWVWGQLTQKELEDHPNVSLSLPTELPVDFPQLKVLRQLHGGADGKVFVVLTSDFEFVVVKKFQNRKNDQENDQEENKRKCELEAKVWREAHEVQVLELELIKSPALIIPFVFLCVENENQLSFDFDLSSWGKPDGSSFTNDERFRDCEAKIKSFVETTDTSVGGALISAIESLASRCFVHHDLEWRHVALLPVFHEGTLVAMKPILIDLSSVEIVGSAEEAREQMRARKEELLAQLNRQGESESKGEF